MRNFICFLLFLATSLAFNAVAKSGYIYDKRKIIWTLKGPSKEYMVAKDYKPGSLLQTVDGVEEKDGYLQVVDVKGFKSWIPAHYLLSSSSIALDEALLTIEDIKGQHAAEISRIEAKFASRAPLEEINKRLNGQIAAMQNELESLRETNRSVTSQFQQDVYFAGGLTVFLGTLIGWFFGIKGRKRKDGWG